MKPLPLVFAAAVIVGCSSSPSRMVSPTEPTPRPAQVSPNAQGPECARFVEIFRQRSETILRLLAQIEAIENKTEKDIAAQEELQQQLDDLTRQYCDICGC